METKSSKQSEGLVTSLWNKYSTDIFFRTTCHIIILQTILTVIIVTGLWFVMDYLVKGSTQTLIEIFTRMLEGETISPTTVSERLEKVRIDQFWTVVVITSAIVISFGFIMVYVALTPTRRSLERKKRFIRNISHELRTPLSILRTNTDVTLLDKDLPERVRQRIERNIVECDRMSEIMDNLLGLSHLMHDQQIPFEDVDLSVLAQKAIDSLSETIDHKDISLTLRPHTRHTVFGNATALEQVIFNLIKNAIAHIESRGSITVEIDAASDGKYVDLSVSDTGSGIERRDLFHIFEPFYRSRKSNKKNAGQGLGLAIVNEIVQMHRGKINIKSTVGRGTIVTVSIKRSVEEGEISKIDKKSDMEEVSMDFSNRILD